MRVGAKSVRIQGRLAYTVFQSKHIRCGGKRPCVPGGHTCQYLPRKKKEAQTVGERELLDNVGVEEIEEREPTSCTECRSRHVKYNECRPCEGCVLSLLRGACANQAMCLGHTSVSTNEVVGDGTRGR